MSRSLPAVVLLSLVVLAATAQAQMSGTYTIDPNGSGSRNFKDFSNATYQLFVQGVSGPVTFDVASGTYYHRWFIPPINGVSATNTVTFKSKTPLGAKMGASTDYKIVEIADYTPQFPVQWIVLDGFEFINTSTSTTGAQYAIYALGSVLNFEIKNCKFSRTSLVTASRSQVYGPDNWKIHHNIFELDKSRIGALIQSSGAFEIYNNQFTLKQSVAAIQKKTTYLGTAKHSRIYNNVIAGTIKSPAYAVEVDASTDIDHNTISMEGDTSITNHCVSLAGLVGRHCQLRNNILLNTTKGATLYVRGDLKTFTWFADANIYHAPNSALGLVYASNSQTAYNTLGSWQQASGEDKNSISKDPQLMGGSSFPDRLKLKTGSPAAGSAKNTPSWVTTDFAGTKRPTPASIGAFEGIGAATFAAFGKGCPGALNNVPKIGYTGDLKLGSANFAITLSNALGGAKTVFAIGLSNTKIGSISLPLSLGGNCNLLTSSDLLLQLTAGGSGPGNGTASVKFRIPNNQALKGAKAHFQWGVVDSAAKGIGLAFSDGATVTL